MPRRVVFVDAFIRIHFCYGYGVVVVVVVVVGCDVVAAAAAAIASAAAAAVVFTVRGDCAVAAVAKILTRLTYGFTRV